jgi:myo-inositol-1-phosphate synthase
MPHISSSGNGNGHLISGYSLAHRKLGYEERLQLAVDVKNRVRGYTQTDAEIAASFKVSPSQLSRESKRQAEWEAENNIRSDRDDYAAARIVEGVNIASPSALDKALRDHKEVLTKVWDALDRLTG